MTAWGVHRISDMIAGKSVATQVEPGVWVRAVPLPFSGGTIRAAWMVLTGRAYAIQWPEAGDLERALNAEH